MLVYEPHREHAATSRQTTCEHSLSLASEAGACLSHIAKTTRCHRLMSFSEEVATTSTPWLAGLVKVAESALLLDLQYHPCTSFTPE